MTDSTLLLRQIHPSFVQAGRATSQAFRPTPKDKGLLSTYDGDQISAEDSWHHFVSKDHRKSAGVMALTVQECTREALPVRPDQEAFPEHVVIDFTEYNDNQREKKGKQLRIYAATRGWLYQPSTLE